jgi:hypothetical protein
VEQRPQRRGAAQRLVGTPHGTPTGALPTDAKDRTAEREILIDLGAPEDRIYLDSGLTGTHRNRPGPDSALAALRASR